MRRLTELVTLRLAPGSRRRIMSALKPGEDRTAVIPEAVELLLTARDAERQQKLERRERERRLAIETWMA